MAKTICIDLLAHADYSARFKRTKDTPGFAAFATQIERIRRENPAGTILLDAGDEFCSKFWEGEEVVRAVAKLGTDAMTLGNHEFDRGKEFLENCVGKADFPVLCANIVEKRTGNLVSGVRPWVILDKAGVKIGVLGLTTEYTPFMVTAMSFEPYRALSAAELGARYIPQMRKAGAQVIVVLSHFPFYADENGGISGELPDVMAQIPPVDVFVGGHIPGDYAQIAGDTAVVKGGFGGNSLAHVRVQFDPLQQKIISKECRVILVDAEAETIETYRRYEEGLVAPLRNYLGAVLTVSPEKLDVRLAHESALGDLLADAVRNAADAQISYMNATSAGGGIDSGPVTVEDVTSVIGYNDPVYTGLMTGKQLRELLELVYVPERFGNNAGLMFSGIVVRVDHTKDAFHKVLAITLQDGNPIEEQQVYTVATSEYMASGGNDTSQIANAIPWESTGIRIYDAIFRFFREQTVLRVPSTDRLLESGEPENNHAPF